MSIKDFLDEKTILNILLFFVPGFLLIQTYRYVSGMERTNTNDRLIIYSIVVSFIFNFIYNLLYKWVMTWPKANDAVVQAILIASILVACILLGVIIGKTKLPERLSKAICHRTQEDSPLMAFINNNRYKNVTATIIKEQEKKTLYYTGQVYLFPESQSNSEYVLWHYKVRERVDEGDKIKYVLTRDYNRDNQTSDKSFLYIKAADEIHFHVEDSENVTRLIELFMGVVFGREGENKDHKAKWVITRWPNEHDEQDHDIKLEIIRGTKKDINFIDDVIHELNKVEGLPPIRRVEKGGNNKIHISEKEMFRTILHNPDGKNIESAESFMPNEDIPKKRRNLIIKCILRSLGLQYNVNNKKYGKSIFQKECEYLQYLSDLDLRIIEMLYSPAALPGMNYKETTQKLKLWLKTQKEYD